MSFMAKYAFRNVWRNPRRTIILILGLSMANALVIWSLNFNESALNEIIKDITNTFVGQEQITKKGLYTDYMRKMDSFHFMNEEMISPELLSRPDTTKRILTGVFLASAKKTIGTLLVGVNPEKELKITEYPNAVNKGVYLNNANAPNPILIGHKMASILQVNLGDEIVVLGQGVDGSVANDLYTVVGMMDFGGAYLETSIAVTNFESARNFISMPDNTFHSIVRFGSGTPMANISDQTEIYNWGDMIPSLKVSIDFMDIFIWMTSMVLNFVICIGMSNSVMISFLERKKEIQSLNVIGASYKWITKSMGLEIIFLSLIAIIVGNFLAYLACSYFNIHPIDLTLFSGGKPLIQGGIQITPKVKIVISTINFFKASAMLIVFMVLAMIYPMLNVLKRSRHASNHQ